jgi:hypothetical protein
MLCNEAFVLWVILALNILTILISFRKRALLYALHNAIFTFLVTGQAFQIRADLDRSHIVFYLLNFISDVGFRSAVWYIFGVSLFSLALAVVSKGYTRSSQPGTRFVFEPSRGFYFRLFVVLCAASFVLIFLVIGLADFLHSSRPGFQSGSAIFIVLLFLGVIPILLKILFPGKIRFGDIACLGLTFAITGVLSRTHLILYLVVILTTFYYARGWSDRPHTLALFSKVFAFGLVAAVLIFGIGALHDAQNFTHGSLGDLVGYILKNPERSVLSIEYNYRIGVEGMSGTAGAVSHYLSDPYTVHFDYGSSWLLRGSAQWLPGFLKGFASPILDLGDTLNWHPDSIVASGVESFFVDFGWFGIVLYPLASYLLGWTLPLKIASSPWSPKLKLASYTAAGWTIMFVHGALAVWMALTISYFVIILVFWPIFRRQIKVKAPISIDDATGIEPGLA